MKVFEAKTFIESMEARSQEYKVLREKLEQVKRKCNDIVNLDDQFKGKGADAIKGFYQAQIDVIEALLRLIDRNIAFFNGIPGTTEDMELSGNTIVHVPFLEDELTHHTRNHQEMVSSQQNELQKIFNRIDDLVPLQVFSKDRFDIYMENAEKERKDTIDAVNQLDHDLKSEYMLSEGDEQYAVTLLGQLIEATRQGNTISPIHFNLEAYKTSDVYQLKEQAEQQTIDYLTFKKNQEEVRKRQAKIEAEIEARKRAEAEFSKLNPIEKSLRSFKEIGNDFWEGLEARNEKKFHSLYDFGNYITVGSFDTTKALYQEMGDRAHVAMKSPYDFVNYITMGTLDLGNGAINPEESFSKEHWLSSIGLASILAGGAKPIVNRPKTPSLQNKDLILEKTVNKAHELTMKTKAEFHFLIDKVRGGINVLLNSFNNDNFAYSPNGIVQKMPTNAMDTEAVKKVLDRVLSKFSLSGFGKGAGNGAPEVKFTKELLETKPKNSPIPERWEKKGGIVEIDKNGTWIYTNKKGQTVSYTGGYPDFTPYMHPTVKPVEIKIATPTNRPLDYKEANLKARLNKDSDPPVPSIIKPPLGYIWHHHQDGKTMILVEKDIHREFTHTGGVSTINGK